MTIPLILRFPGAMPWHLFVVFCDTRIMGDVFESPVTRRDFWKQADPSEFDTSWQDAAVELSRQWRVPLLPIIKDVKRVLNNRWVETLLHQLQLHLLEGSCHLHDILEGKTIIIHDRALLIQNTAECAKRNHPYSYKARPSVWGEVADHVVIYSRAIEPLPFSDSDGSHSDASLVACVAEQTQGAVAFADYKTSLSLSGLRGTNLVLGLHKRWPLWDKCSSTGCPTLPLLLHSHLSTCEGQWVTAITVKYGDVRFRIFEKIQSYIKKSQPECVTHAVLEVNKVVAVDPHQVSAVEVKISFLQDVTESFLLSLFFVLYIANKRGNCCDLGHKQSHLTLKIRTFVFQTVDSSCVKTTTQNTKIRPF